MFICKLLLLFISVFSYSSFLNANTLNGKVRIDGSSTVFPITEAVAEEFNLKFPRVRVAVGVSGTGGGFKKFLNHEVDINDASREIKASEMAQAQKNNIEYFEFPVAYDGITVVVNKDNTWAKEITVQELNKIWNVGSTVKLWSDIREDWPKKEIKLFGPGTDSGTFDYFTHAINGKSHVSRSDFTKSEDDNVLVTGVAGNKYSLGFFGFAYYKENSDKVHAVAIKENQKAKAILPSIQSINDGSYKPLSRPVYIYVSKKSLEKVEVKEFVKFYLEQASKLSEEVGYISLPNSSYQASLKTIEKLKVYAVAN